MHRTGTKSSKRTLPKPASCFSDKKKKSRGVLPYLKKMTLPSDQTRTISAVWNLRPHPLTATPTVESVRSPECATKLSNSGHPKLGKYLHPNAVTAEPFSRAWNAHTAGGNSRSLTCRNAHWQIHAAGQQPVRDHFSLPDGPISSNEGSASICIQFRDHWKHWHGLESPTQPVDQLAPSNKPGN